ncbi:hypothetical protein Bca4012_019650 [Brassica carinata]
MYLVMNLMKEVELEEKDAEMSVSEATKGCLDTLEKVEEFKKMLKHVKEANDLVRSIWKDVNLATEAKELENRLLNLSEERIKRDAFMSFMRHMRETLIRLAAALEMKKATEQEKKANLDSPLKALQQEAEKNSKLREFLMDCGQKKLSSMRSLELETPAEPLKGMLETSRNN